MRDLKLHDGDLELVDGDFALTDSVAQALRIGLKTLAGEWFLDEQIGIPYFTQILGQKMSKLSLTGIFREAILKTDGVSKLTQIDVDYDASARQVKLDFEVELTDGSRETLHV